jgi:hypothetical protein
MRCLLWRTLGFDEGRVASTPRAFPAQTTHKALPTISRSSKIDDGGKQVTGREVARRLSSTPLGGMDHGTIMARVHVKFGQVRKSHQP